MNRLLRIVCFIIPFFFLGCDNKEDTFLPSNIVDPCTLANGSLRWNDLTSVCANFIFADDAAGTMTINGTSLAGPNITFELQNTQPGTYVLTDSLNSVLYLSQLGFAYQTTNDNPGTLVIESNDLANNKIKGTFDVTLRDPTGVTGNKTITGSFSILYTE